MRDKRKTLPSVLLAILGALGILIGLSIAGLLLASTILLKSEPILKSYQSDTFSLFAIIFLAITTCVFNFFTFKASIRYLQSKASKPITSPGKKALWGFLFLWVITLTAGYFASQKPDWFLVLALLTTFAILLPIWILISIARIGLPRSTRQREHGTLTIGLTVSPILIILAEMVLIVGAAMVVIFTLGFQDQLSAQIPELLEGLASTNSGMADVESALFDLMRQPLIAAAVFVSLGIIAPLIEEIFKPMALFFLLNRPLRDDEGYGLGLVSGGAFALLESAGMVIQMDPQDWLAAVILRAATGVLHIGLSGLVGFGLTHSFNLKKPAKGVLFILAAAGLHGLWNSLALYSGLAAFPAADSVISAAPATGTIISIGLMILVFIAVILINSAIRRLLIKDQESRIATNQ